MSPAGGPGVRRNARPEAACDLREHTRRARPGQAFARTFERWVHLAGVKSAPAAGGPPPRPSPTNCVGEGDVVPSRGQASGGRPHPLVPRDLPQKPLGEVRWIVPEWRAACTGGEPPPPGPLPRFAGRRGRTSFRRAPSGVALARDGQSAQADFVCSLRRIHSLGRECACHEEARPGVCPAEDVPGRRCAHPALTSPVPDGRPPRDGNPPVHEPSAKADITFSVPRIHSPGTGACPPARSWPVHDWDGTPRFASSPSTPSSVSFVDPGRGWAYTCSRASAGAWTMGRAGRAWMDQ